MGRESFEPGEDTSLEGFVSRAASKHEQEKEEGVKVERSLAYAYRMPGVAVGMIQELHLFHRISVGGKRPRAPSRSDVNDGLVNCGLQRLTDEQLLEPFTERGKRVIASRDGQAVLSPARWDPSGWGFAPCHDMRFRVRAAVVERMRDLANECWITPSVLVTIVALAGLAQSERWLVPDAWLFNDAVSAFSTYLQMEEKRLDMMLHARQGAERL